MADKKTVTLFNYIGGKGWLREHLRDTIKVPLKNKSFSTYAEPFAGGLGAFLGVYDILAQHGIKKIILNDINGKLINFYKTVYEQPQELIDSYLKLESKFVKTIPVETFTLHKTKEKEKIKFLLTDANNFYKEVRTKFNNEKNPLKNSIYLLFLQNHCFNGVYRENSSGGYNTPFNWEARNYTREKVEPRVQDVFNIFQQFEIEFSNKSFDKLDYNKETLYYLDPPYINEIEAHENQYNKDSFNADLQKKLIQHIKNSSFLYSNHDNPLLIEAFKSNQVNVKIKRIARKNIISASNESRKTDKIEILVYSKD